ncbi:myosin heavy chain-related protein [Artemisia annua]|uniref:Dolichyl-diphosphooligosaccharide--protein glycosyltransferase subunit 2 n=1 Tax=Artemisia annua TaxID=35608 RepID=A0A2U1KG06_ARTAN|nr:myosin heavy chain-related protein [Artemisia annua]
MERQRSLVRTPSSSQLVEQDNDSALEGVAANIKLLLKLVQDHKEACQKNTNDGRRMLRVAGMMTILDLVRTRIQKCQSFGVQRAALRRCNSDIRACVEKDKAPTDSMLDDQKEMLKRELNVSMTARKTLEKMCSSLGKEKEIMMVVLDLLISLNANSSAASVKGSVIISDRPKSLEEAYGALRTFKVLGIEKKPEDTTCKSVVDTLSSASSNSKDLYHALRVNGLLKCKTSTAALEGIASRLKDGLKHSTLLLDYYHSVGGLLLIKDQSPEVDVLLGNADGIVRYLNFFVDILIIPRLSAKVMEGGVIVLTILNLALMLLE